jgi:hypothetical protein
LLFFLLGFYIGSLYVAHANLEPKILLPQPS